MASWENISTLENIFSIFSQISYGLHISYDWPSSDFMATIGTQKQCVSYILNYINFDPNDF